MRIDVVLRKEDLSDAPLPGARAVVIDVLRASSVMVTAMATGALTVRPFATEQEAREAYERAEVPSLLAGERGGIRLPGFHLGNSPRDFNGHVKGRQVLLSTTNGTVALSRIGSLAEKTGVASFLNARAVARWLAEAPGNVILCCAGTEGAFSYDDALCAGWICRLMKRYRSEQDVVWSDTALALSDCAAFLEDLSESEATAALSQRLKQSYHGRRLIDLDMESDIDFCAQLDRFEEVPIYDPKTVQLSIQAPR